MHPPSGRAQRFHLLLAGAYCAELLPGREADEPTDMTKSNVAHAISLGKDVIASTLMRRLNSVRLYIMNEMALKATSTGEGAVRKCRGEGREERGIACSAGNCNKYHRDGRESEEEEDKTRTTGTPQRTL